MMFKYMCLVLFITWYQLADCHPAKSDVQSIDSMIDKESEAFLSVEANESSQKTVRDKRTIGFLRQLFPNFSQIVDRKIQQITRFLFRVIGRLVLRGGGAGAGAGGAAAGGGGGGASEAGGSGGRRISITLPTFPPSTDDEDEEQSTEAPAAATPESVESRAGDAADTTSLPLAAAADSAAAASSDSAADTAATTVNPTTAAVTAAAVTTDAPATVNPAAAAAATITTTNAGTTNAAITTISPPTTQRPSDSDNTVGTVVKRTAREASTEETSSAQKRSPLTDTENNEVSSDNTLQNTDDAQTETEEDPRNKRFLLNLRGGGGGGSGNFLFDLIRRGADRAARAAGGFYRVVAGTDPNTLTLAQPLQYPSLVAGSGANQDRDESVDATPLEAETQEVRADLNGKEDGYSVGVPGPLTRIFVIANRGVANLVQDLILRLAQTTERIVNFKARLITSLI